MTYQKKYWFQFYDIRATERLHLVELWQNTEDTLTAEEIKGHNVPFTIEMPEIDHKFQVVRGCGCQINFLSETDMKFYTGLYHVNPTDFMVKHYIDGVINFYGYLNSEMMSEPYDTDFNYQVSVTGNDGFSLMDRFSFIQTDESNYTGVKSKFELLQIIFAKIGLPFTEYRIALSTTFTGYSGDADSSILHESFIDCANFYDEDNKPMSLRGVVESILAPYGAHIRAEGGNIYITDIHSLASLTSVTYKRFTMSTGAYVADVAISNVKAIADIGYLGTGHGIERSGGVNRQVVAYSPYPLKEIINESIVGIGEFGTVPETWSTKDDYYYKTLEDNAYWEFDAGRLASLNPPSFEESYYLNQNDENIYMRIPRYTGLNGQVAFLKVNPYLNLSFPPYGVASELYKLLKIQISGELLVKSKDNPYSEAEESAGFATQIVLWWEIKIGDKYYDNTSNAWTTTPSFIRIQVSGNSANIFDVFTSFTRRIYVDAYLRGELSIKIYSDYDLYGVGIGGYLDDSVKELWYKNLKFELVRFDNSDVPDDDIEYIGLLDRTFQNEGEKITLTCGTDTVMSDRGKIMYFDGTDYADITAWTRNSQTFKIEELLLGSVSSNYRAGFVTLLNMKLKNSFVLQNILTDTFIGTAKMMVKRAAIDYRNDVFDCDLVEVLPDELDIVLDATIT